MFNKFKRSFHPKMYSTFKEFGGKTLGGMKLRQQD